MDIKAFLQGVKDGSIAFEQAEQMLLKMPYEDLGFAKLDHHRGLRGGFNEVIFGQGKTPEQLGTILPILQAKINACWPPAVRLRITSRCKTFARMPGSTRFPKPLC